MPDNGSVDPNSPQPPASSADHRSADHRSAGHRSAGHRSPEHLSADQQRSLLYNLLDDASLFPPGSLPMPAAVAAHVRHERAWFSELTGPFVCPESKLTELGRALTTASVPWIDLSLVVTGGAAAVAAAIDAVAADARLRLRAVEVPAATGKQPAQAIADVAAALDRVPLASATAYVEFPLAAIADRSRPSPTRPPPARCSTWPTGAATGPSCAPGA